jgi:hypothetical protein
MNAANLMCRLKSNATGFTKIRTCVKAELSKGPIPVKPLALAFIKHKDLCQKKFPRYSTDIIGKNNFKAFFKMEFPP